MITITVDQFLSGRRSFPRRNATVKQRSRRRQRRIFARSHRHATCTPTASLFLEHAGNVMTAKPASTVLNIPLTELVPITLNQQLAAAGTPRAAAFAIVQVSSVNVMQPF